MKLLKAKSKDQRGDHNNFSFFTKIPGISARRLVSCQWAHSRRPTEFFPEHPLPFPIAHPSSCPMSHNEYLTRTARGSRGKLCHSERFPQCVYQKFWCLQRQKCCLKSLGPLSNNISGTSILTSEIFQKPTTHLNVSSSSNSDFPKVLINF